MRRSTLALTLLVFTLGSGASWLASRAAQRNADALTDARFRQASERLIADLHRRIELPGYGLRGARAMLAAGVSTTPEEAMKRYVSARDLVTEFPGALDFGFIERGEGPNGTRYVVTAVEPLEHNASALGFDVGSEPLRRHAIEAAIDSGELTLMPAVRLVQHPQSPGFLLYLPVYAGPARTVTERRQSLVGVLYAPLTSRLFDGTLAAADGLLDVDLYDDTDGARELLYDPDFHAVTGVLEPARWTDAHRFTWAGRSLEFVIRSTPRFEAEQGSPRFAVLGSGLVVAALLAFLAWLLLTRRDEASRALEMAEHENATLLRTIDQHFFVSLTDANGTILRVNKAMTELTGYANDELVGQNHRVLNSKAHPPELWSSMWADIRAGKSWRAEVCNRRRDGSLFWVDTLIAPLPTLDGRPDRFISIRSDITERKQEQGQLQQQTELARQASLAKSSFLANMSHEIRTPMNGVLGMTELLLGMNLNAEQKEAARIIYRSAEALLSLLNDILDFSKIEAGKIEFEDLTWDPAAVAYDVAELFRPRVLGRTVELLVRVAPNTPASLRGDPSRVRQVLVNLVGNAVKFVERGLVLIDLSVRGEQLVVQVRDTGPGIPVDRQRVLFQPFTQADAATARRFGGTGLGLAISRRLAAGMGGTLDFTSTLGEGTTFELTLPLRDPVSADDDRPLTGLTVLVAEPSSEQRAIVTEQLRALGAVVEAPTDPLVPQRWSKLDVVLWADAIVPAVLPAGPAHVVQSARPGAGPLPSVARSCPRGWLGETVLRAVKGLPAASKVTPMPARPFDGRNLRVLLADDNQINQRVASAMLEKLGCRVTTVSDGAEAITRFQQGPFDLVLMDCQMPEVDGFVATRACRVWEAMHALTPTPIIALTANASADDRAESLAAGMNEHLAKPLRAADLDGLLRRLFGAPAARVG